MKIEIVGSNTLNGIKLRKRVLKVANDMDSKITICLVDDCEQSNLPILYINNELISKGVVLAEKEIVKYLKKYCK